MPCCYCHMDDCPGCHSMGPPDDEEARLFRKLHRWHEKIEDRHREVKLRVEEHYRALLELRDRLRELRKQQD